jgi:hypothetical protein
MKSAAERLAMLAEHGIDLDHVPGGWSQFAALDIAAALGMDHDPLSADLLLAKYSGNGTAYSSARIWWRMRVADHSLAQGWPRGRPGTTFRMADVSLDEWIDAQRCRSCHGAAQALIDSKLVQCPACLGTGLLRRSARSEARALGMPESSYRAGQWADRLVWCRQRLLRIELEALERLARRLRHDS